MKTNGVLVNHPKGIYCNGVLVNHPKGIIAYKMWFGKLVKEGE